MWSFLLTMRLHDGTQTCENCGGQGCYWCRNTGARSQCPVCMNQEPELLSKAGEYVTCQSCGTTFDSEGQIADRGMGDPDVNEMFEKEAADDAKRKKLKLGLKTS